MPLLLPRIYSWLPKASIAACLLLGMASHAQAARLGDWECLTSDLNGSEQVRQEFIQASRYASRTFNIAPPIMVAIKRVESGRGLNPNVYNNNNNGTVDRGFYQVNTEVWLPEIRRVGGDVSVQDLHGIRQNALIAAWILRRQMNRSDVQGSLEAVAYYHKGGGASARANQIRQRYKDLFMRELRVLISRCG